MTELETEMGKIMPKKEQTKIKDHREIIANVEAPNKTEEEIELCDKIIKQYGDIVVSFYPKYYPLEDQKIKPMTVKEALKYTGDTGTERFTAKDEDDNIEVSFNGEYHTISLAIEEDEK